MPLSEEQELAIRKLALKNALDYSKASAGAVLGKAVGLFPELRKDMAALSGEVNRIVDSVNALSADKLQQEFSPYAAEFEKEEKEKAARTSKPKFELPGAVAGAFATRFPPEPQGYMHMGHAKVAFMEREFADMYKGKLFLYFDDTNPEHERQEYVDAFKSDLRWLGIGYDAEYYASDNIETMYGYARQLINGGDAYVCVCDAETVKKNRFEGIECADRNNTQDTNLEMFEGMVKGDYKEESAVLRFRVDMKSKNTALRDPTLMRIKNMPHYRQGTKYVLWPTYDMNTPIMDSLKGVTDAIRDKNYELRDELNAMLVKKLKLRPVRIHSEARTTIRGNMTSKRKIRALVSEGKVSGWDDPRLITIAALRRRGILPEAIKRFSLRFGMSKSNEEVGMDMLLAENRKLVDKDAKRLFFIEDPVKVRISGFEKMHAKLKLHPQVQMGYREYDIGNVLYISGGDAMKLKAGDKVRLKDLLNIEVKDVGKDGISAQYIGNENIDTDKIQWVDENNYEHGSIWRIGDLLKDEEFNADSINIVNGYIEKYVSKLDESDVVNFERMGFYKLDNKDKLVFLEL